MKSINNEIDNFEIEYVNAIIEDNYIIPGINGVTVDRLNTYYAMKKNESFDKDLFVLKETTPKNSYYNHTDLIITSGNPLKNSISIIVHNNKDVLEYLINKKMVFTRLVDINTVKSKASYEQINNDFLHYEEVEKILDKNKLNNNICIVSNYNIDICKNYGKYLVQPTYEINNIDSGNIILIKDNMSLTRFKLLLKQISFKKIKLSYLNYLISENR